MMMMMIMIAGFVDSITTPIKSWLDDHDTSSDDEDKNKTTAAKMTVLIKEDIGGKGGGGVEETCIVCLCEVELGERFAMLDTCKHGFHVECVEAWLKHHPNCPLCRTPVVVFPKYHEQQQQQDQQRSVEETRRNNNIYLKKLVEMTRWCGYRALDKIATWLTKSFSQGLQSTLSESCTYL